MCTVTVALCLDPVNRGCPDDVAARAVAGVRQARHHYSSLMRPLSQWPSRLSDKIPRRQRSGDDEQYLAYAKLDLATSIACNSQLPTRIFKVVISWIYPTSI